MKVTVTTLGSAPKPNQLWITTREAGQWHVVSIDASKIHSVMLPDGSRWDAINGLELVSAPCGCPGKECIGECASADLVFDALRERRLL